MDAGFRVKNGAKCEAVHEKKALWKQKEDGSRRGVNGG